MNGSILYIVTTNVTERPIISGTTESELKSLYEALTSLNAEQNGGMEILDTQRCVISASGKVIYTRVWLCFDKHGLEIHDIYRNLLDSYRAAEPEPKLKMFRVKRYETWSDSIEVEAESEDDAIRIVRDMVYEGEFDVLEGGCTDVTHEVYDLTEGESK